MSEIIATSVAMPQAASLETIAEMAARYRPGRVRAIADPRQAVDAALASEPVACVAGSISLLGALPHVETLRE